MLRGLVACDEAELSVARQVWTKICPALDWSRIVPHVVLKRMVLYGEFENVQLAFEEVCRYVGAPETWYEPRLFRDVPVDGNMIMYTMANN